MQKLFLLDAFALIYRAHFAFSKNPRISSQGLNTGAILGFTNTILDIIKNEKPTHLAVVYDTPEPTFRHIEYPEYKAQRQAQPEDITVAVPYTLRVCEAFQVPVLKLGGFEADDVIGTVAKRLERPDFQVFMMTPDKDYGQLVSENVFLYKPAFLGNEVSIMGVAEVLEKWQIKRIDQVADILGLMGDAVDNIKGIKGIGEKTAAKLIAEFDTVENLVANVDKLKGKTQELVKLYGQDGILSKRLATIDINVPLEVTENQLVYKGYNAELLRNLFDELEFRTLKKRIFGDDKTENSQKSGVSQKSDNPVPQQVAKKEQIGLFGETATPPLNPLPFWEGEAASDSLPEGEGRGGVQVQKLTFDNVVADYQLIDTPELRKSLIGFLALQSEFCFDTETTSTDACEAELVGLSFSYRKHEAFYIPLPEDFEECRRIVSEFKEVLENEQITKIGQNIKYDMIVLETYGVSVKGRFFDTMLAHYLIDPDTRHNMDVLAENYLNYTPIGIDELIGKKGKNQGSMRDVAVEKAAIYAAEDADITLQLKEIFAPQLIQNQFDTLFEEIELPLVEVLAQIERNGVKIDQSALAEYSVSLEKDLQFIENQVFSLAGMSFNLNSPKQMGEVLFDKLKLIEKPTKTKTGQYATGEEVLIKLAPDHEIIRQILEYRQTQKLKSTYVDALPLMVSKRDGLIHTSYNQAVAATGRLSSNNPNLQNIPIRTEKGKEIRKAFITRDPDHILLSADYSQIELRIMAAFSQDAEMIEAFRLGKDIHTITASKLYKVELQEVTGDMRRKAKTANFGIIYGISAFGLAERLNIPRKEAGKIIEAYFQEFPSIKTYMDNIINFAREHEYVETIMRRRRYLRDINSRNQTQRGFAERNAINNPIQGSAADLIKKAMILIHRFLQKEKLRTKMIMQVHDELVFDVYRPELDFVKPKIIELMRTAFEIAVPLEVEAGVGLNWLEAH